MDLGIAGRVAIVGGSSKGMGKATAMAMAREGVNVAICARHPSELGEAATELRAASSDGQVLPVVADLSRPDDIERLVSETTRRWGKVDIVVNNIGGPPPGQPAGLTDEQWHGAFDLLFFSAVRLNRLILPQMRTQHWGRIITILSLSVKEPEDNLALSTVARAALASYQRLLATEVAGDGITVNGVLPGSISTDRLQAVAEMQARFRGRDVAHAMEARLGRIASGRFGQPEGVADLICFLASERAGFLTGLAIPVDGGQLRAMG